MYKVLEYFEDLHDGRHAYHAGDTYPRKGYKAAAERLNELSSSDNRRGVPLIREVKRRTRKAG